MTMLARLAGVALATTLCLVGAAQLDAVPQAHATVALAHPLSELVTLADRSVIATATEQRSQWEDLGGKRIVTYTKLRIDEGVFGQGEKAVWVRTLGGAVGKIGQHVAGQPRLKMGDQSLLFLTRANKASAKTFVVSGAAQGHFPLRMEKRGDNSVRVLRPSPSRGKVLRRPGPSLTAAEVLVGKELGAARALITAEKKAQDARK